METQTQPDQPTTLTPTTQTQTRKIELKQHLEKEFAKTREFLEKKSKQTQSVPNIDYEDLRFQVYCKFSAHGYNDPEEFLEAEPDVAEELASGSKSCRKPTKFAKDARRSLQLLDQFKLDPLVDRLALLSQREFVTTAEIDPAIRRALHTALNQQTGFTTTTVERKGKKLAKLRITRI